MNELDEYLDQIEHRAAQTAEDRRQALDAMSSAEQMSVEFYVSGYETAVNKTAYVRAMAMALVQAGRKSCLQFVV